jgi:N-methylhydantoinase A
VQGTSTSTPTIGVDTGGTFTDIVCRHAGGIAVLKVPSTPDDPARAVIDGVTELLATLVRGRRGRSAADVVHGSTVATNTVLERTGARTAFITTRGFRDLVEIGRQNRPQLYALEVRRPEPLVPRALRIEVAERIGPGGAIERRLDLAGLRRRLDGLGDRVDAVAIGFLFSYRNPTHERLAEGVARQALRGLPVTISSRVSPEMREYERFSTAIINAYVAPRVTRYLGGLRRRLPRGSLEIMGSGGGTVPLERARREPILTVLSGPAAGVLGARELARRVGIEKLITLDMGGTSTDVSLVDGEVSFRGESEIGGLPFRIPVVDVLTVGAGGGSIARVDAGGSLRVGPESAGADPGPAVYGRGNRVTVTDAHVFLGHLGADSFLGGRMPVRPERVPPLMERLARELRLTPVEAARGVLRAADAEMERALRVVSQERGHDPREFTLVAFGGASGLHAAALARGLLIPRILIPPHPGMLCAWGMLAAERVRWRARTVQLAAARLPAREISRIAARLLREAERDFRSMPRAALHADLELDMRFEGQTHVTALRFPGRRGARSPSWGLDASGYEQRFRREYAERFGSADPSWPVEVVTVRVALRAPRAAPPPPLAPPSRRRRGPPSPRARRPMVLDGAKRPRPVPIFDRDDLRPGGRLAGPAVIAEYSATTLVPADCRLEVDRQGNLALERRG